MIKHSPKRRRLQPVTLATRHAHGEYLINLTFFRGTVSPISFRDDIHLIDGKLHHLIHMIIEVIYLSCWMLDSLYVAHVDARREWA
jgi:hypothetical protein